MEAKKLRNVVVELIHGDISACDADAIVNAANNSLWMGSGVAGAIKLAGGTQIEREAMSKGPIEVGQAVETGAGLLKAKYVIHAAVMDQKLKTGETQIASGAFNALLTAERIKADSVAMPALGTGVGGFPVEACARILFDVLRKFDESAPEHVKRVIFVLYTRSAFEDFENIYRLIK